MDVYTDKDSFLNELGGSDIAFLQKEISIETSRRMEELISASGKPQWLHWGYTGLDQLAPLQSLKGRLLITNSKGIPASALGDHVIMVIHMLHREVQRLMRNQMDRVWERRHFEPVRGKTLGIIGLGNIGRDVARKATVFGMKVIGAARREVSVENVTKIFLPEQLPQFLATSDIVVISVPLTAETQGMIGEKELGWMKPKSYLINVARGHILDEDALVRTIKKGQIAGAALDAFVQEPLPPESELWSLDNVIITPHSAGWSKDYPEMALDLFCENLKRFLEGQEMINRVVNLEIGY